MKTKLFSFIVILILSAPYAICQNTDNAKVSFAILGGINLQNLNGKDFAGDKLKNDMIIGYHAGVNVQIPIVPEFFFQPGLLFTTKGAKNSEGQTTSTYNLSYIELPLNFVYKGLLGSGFVMVGFGPYISYGIMGKVKYDGGSADIKFKKVVETTDPADVVYLKAFDAGANIFAGYEMSNGIFFQLNTQFGLLNINPEDKQVTNDKTAIKNTGFGLSLGYRF
jgi:hypothetical protein